MDINQLGEFVANHPLLVMAFLAITVLLIGGELRQRLGNIKDVDPGEATRLLNHENAIMVDMRTDREYRDGHIINAVHAPADGAAATLQKYRDRPLIVYCRTGQQSARFTGQLNKQGFAPVYHLKGGLTAWQQANLPLSRGK